MRRVVLLALVLLGLLETAKAEEPQKWATAADSRQPMTADETRAFMKRLARFVEENHLRKAENSPQRGMIYEYSDVRRKGQFDQFVQGEALDTMHDGAWFGAALVAAYRATGDEYYRDFLVRWVIPFYCRMLNHSDELFVAERDDSDAKAERFKGEQSHTPGEKGFVPYWWDDGNSVSLERRQKKQKLGLFSCVDNLATKENPRFLLDGYSRGSSNHMAQDLGVFIQQAWLLMKDGKDETSRKLAGELAEAAKNLAENRRRRHGRIPMCESPTGLANADTAAMRSLPDPNDPRLFTPNNHYIQSLRDFKPGQRISIPGFADDQEYRYYSGIARAGGELPRPLAFRLIYDAYTQPLLYRIYSDDAEVPPGINVFDLHSIYFKDGKPEDYRSDRKGPNKQPRPIGSRFGPQNMAVCGIALQAMKKWPGIWDEQYLSSFAKDTRVNIGYPFPKLPEVKSPIWNEGIANEAAGMIIPRSDKIYFCLQVSRNPFTLIFCGEPDGKGAAATLKVSRLGAVSVVDAAGAALENDLRVAYERDESFVFKGHVPYTLAKGQRAWLNLIEQHRYSVKVGEHTRNFYLASAESQVRERLERELAGGLRTWEAIFNEFGYIPSGIGTGQDFDHFSDSGGYAHLLHAAAEYLLYLEDKRDWESHGVPKVN